MKKVLAALALVATIGFFGIQQADAQRGAGWGGGPAGAYCWKANQGQQVMDEDTKKSYNAFMDATVDLRREMFSKKEQMRALSYAANPDEAKIDVLAKEMFDLRTQIQAKADETGWQGGAGYGGPGRGYGRHMGYGMGPGMGYGMGYGRGGCGPCPNWN